jgi:hypothetical protein
MALAHCLRWAPVLLFFSIDAGACFAHVLVLLDRWEERYTHELQMAHPDCVGCNAILPFALHGREKSCISHCELVMPPDSTAEDCENRCWKLRLARAYTDEPCAALGYCPSALIAALSPRRATVNLRERHVRPVVIISGGDKSKAFEDIVAKWIAISLPDALVRRLVLTDYDLEEESSVRLERAYMTLRPLHEQLARVCGLIESDPNLSNGMDIVAFGQGGLVARGYVQVCNDPRVHTLITYNTPHAGCASGALRDSLRALERLGGGFGPGGGETGQASDEYSVLVQSVSAAAGYYRDGSRLGEYVDKASFLPDVNLEREPRVRQGGGGGGGEVGGAQGERERLAGLGKLVLIKGTGDHVIEPMNSAWFETFEDGGSKGGSKGSKGITRLMDSAVYHRLGLSELDIDGRCESRRDLS